MKIIIPMAGRGSRLRPHTLTVPKPLLPIAGKPMVQRLVEELIASLPEKVDEIAYVIGDFGERVEHQLIEIANNIGAQASIYYQDIPLGPGHALLCAKKSITGKCIVAFSDTLFKANFSFNPKEDGIIWVQNVDDPSNFGVVSLDDHGVINDFVEKPTTFISRMAIVGIYYVKDGDQLCTELQRLVDEDIREKGEYQLTTALELLKKKGKKFKPAFIEEWLDCGNKANVLHTNKRMLELKQESEKLISPTAVLHNAVVIPPCAIGNNSRIENTVLGPHVAVGSNCVVQDSVITNSVIQNEAKIRNANLAFSMIGNKVDYQGKSSEISLGDYSQV